MARTVVVVVRVSTLATVAVALARLATGIRMTRLILFQHSFAHIVVAAGKNKRHHTKREHNQRTIGAHRCVHEPRATE